MTFSLPYDLLPIVLSFAGVGEHRFCVRHRASSHMSHGERDAMYARLANQREEAQTWAKWAAKCNEMRLISKLFCRAFDEVMRTQSEEYVEWFRNTFETAVSALAEEHARRLRDAPFTIKELEEVALHDFSPLEECPGQLFRRLATTSVFAFVKDFARSARLFNRFLDASDSYQGQKIAKCTCPQREQSHCSHPDERRDAMDRVVDRLLSAVGCSAMDLSIVLLMTSFTGVQDTGRYFHISRKKFWNYHGTTTKLKPSQCSCVCDDTYTGTNLQEFANLLLHGGRYYSHYGAGSIRESNESIRNGDAVALIVQSFLFRDDQHAWAMLDTLCEKFMNGLAHSRFRGGQMDDKWRDRSLVLRSLFYRHLALRRPSLLWEYLNCTDHPSERFPRPHWEADVRPLPHLRQSWVVFGVLLLADFMPTLVRYHVCRPTAAQLSAAFPLREPACAAEFAEGLMTDYSLLGFSGCLASVLVSTSSRSDRSSAVDFCKLHGDLFVGSHRGARHVEIDYVKTFLKLLAPTTIDEDDLVSCDNSSAAVSPSHLRCWLLHFFTQRYLFDMIRRSARSLLELWCKAVLYHHHADCCSTYHGLTSVKALVVEGKHDLNMSINVADFVDHYCKQKSTAVGCHHLVRELVEVLSKG